MALVKDSAGRETVAPRKWRPLPQQGRGPVLNPRPIQLNELMPGAAPARQAAPAQPVFQVQPAPAAQPMLVQVVPQQQQPQLAVSPVPQAASDFGFTMPKSQTILVPEPEQPYSREPRTLDQALRSTWGNLENEGAAGMVAAREQGTEPRSRGDRNAQQIQNLADAYDRQATRGERGRKRTEREKSDRKETMKRLTPEQWAALSPLQQAAVQANADLHNAIQRDIKTQSRHGRIGDEGRRENVTGLENYRSATGELFNEDDMLGVKGLEFAPNTVAFLKSRGIDRQALAGRTLDDILLGDTLFTPGVIKNLDQEVPAVDPFKTGQQLTQRQSNIAFAQAIAKGQLAYQEKLAAQLKKGDQLLAGMTSRGTNAEAVDEFGARGQAKANKLTAVRPETLAQMDKYMEALARPDRDPAETLSVIETDLAQLGADQNEINQVYRSMADRVRLAMQGDGKWFPNVEYDLRSPDEVGKILGLTTLKRAEG